MKEFQPKNEIGGYGMENFTYKLTGKQNERIKRLTSHKFPIDKKTGNIEIFLNDGEFIRGCLILILENFTYSSQRYEQEMTRSN